MEHWKIILIFVSVLIICLNIFMIIEICEGEMELPNTPGDVYEEHDNLNWFGAVVVYLLDIILFPFIYLFKFIYFIFTVGRKD